MNFQQISIVFVLLGYVGCGSHIVDTPCGKIQGSVATAINNKNYLSFWNIPYAKAPIGNLRFAKPEPFPKFDNVFDASVEKAVMCRFGRNNQWLEGFEISDYGSEDCLILSVHTPMDVTVKHKVIIFIHGGGFLVGSSSIYPFGTFLTEQNVIVVTINYRLGVLGFLSTENEASPGNFGLWDQALALKWVKDNIAAFGGDPDDVTISGESAGGASVMFHSISPRTKGLFTKVYSHSGTSTAVWALANNPRSNALIVAKSAGCWDGEKDEQLNLQESQRLVECLRKVPLSAFDNFAYADFQTPAFVPCVDGDFIPKRPSKLLNDDAYLESVGFFDRTYLFAINNNELMFIDREVKAVPDYQFDKNIDSRTYPNILSAETRNKITDWYKRRYVDFVPQLVSDLYFLIPNYDFLDVLARNKSTNSWLLYFNHYPSYMKGDYRGIFHTLDLLYWSDFPLEFHAAIFKTGANGEMDKEDLDLKQTFSGIVGEFVRSGNLRNSLNSQLPQGWPTYDLQGSYFLDFGPEPKVKRHLDVDKKELWLKKVPAWMKQFESVGEQRDEL